MSFICPIIRSCNISGNQLVDISVTFSVVLCTCLNHRIPRFRQDRHKPKLPLQSYNHGPSPDSSYVPTTLLQISLLTFQQRIQVYCAMFKPQYPSFKTRYIFTKATITELAELPFTSVTPDTFPQY